MQSTFVTQPTLLAKSSNRIRAEVHKSRPISVENVPSLSRAFLLHFLDRKSTASPSHTICKHCLRRSLFLYTLCPVAQCALHVKAPTALVDQWLVLMDAARVNSQPAAARPPARRGSRLNGHAHSVSGKRLHPSERLFFDSHCSRTHEDATTTARLARNCVVCHAFTAVFILAHFARAISWQRFS